MKFECCSREKIRYELANYLDGLEDNKSIKIEITKCPMLKGTFDLSITEDEVQDKGVIEE